MISAIPPLPQLLVSFTEPVTLLSAEGSVVGAAVGATVGVAVGATVGTTVGATVGVAVGATVGVTVGCGVSQPTLESVRLTILPPFQADKHK